ncbi:MAG: hypothetical protein ACSHXL_00815 [Bacteroidota bacterium]
MKIIIFCILAAWFAIPVANAQKERVSTSVEEVEIIGKLSDGKPLESITKELPNYEIKRSHQIREGGRIVTIKEVEKPVAVPEIERIGEAVSEDQSAPRHHFLVTATTYEDSDDTTTLVKWQSLDHGVESELVCWSNVDWANLEGFTSFRAKGQESTFMLLHSSQSLENLRQASRVDKAIKPPKIPSELPKLQDAGASYLMVSGKHEINKQSAQMMLFIEGIHDLYAVKQKELNEAKSERVRNAKLQQEEFRKNPPKPEDMTLFFWNNNVAPKK